MSTAFRSIFCLQIFLVMQILSATRSDALVQNLQNEMALECWHQTAKFVVSICLLFSL